MRFRIPELFLGAFLSVAIFAMGMVFSSQYSRQTTQADGTEKSNQPATSKSEPKGFWEGVTTDPVAAFTLGLVFVGAFQVGLFWVQLKIIGESLTDAKIAADAAKRAAKATEDAVELSRDTAQRQLRAYVIAGPSGVRYEDLLKDRIVVEVTIRNTGQTPAREMTVVSRTCVLAYPLEMPFDFTLVSGPDPSHSTLGKDQTLLHESDADAILTGDEMLRVTNPEGGFRVYTYGTIDYRDVFDVPQHTNFCCTHLFREDEALGHNGEYHNDAS
jgi:hypothetical protein